MLFPVEAAQVSLGWAAMTKQILFLRALCVHCVLL